MTELTTVQGIAGATAQDLKDQGIETAEDLAQVDPDSIDVPTGNVKTLVSRAKQITIASKSAKDLLDEYGTIEPQPTGVDGLDESLGGGYEPETIGLIYGKSGMGKTQLVFTSLAEAASEGTVVYIQTEMQSKSIAERLVSIAGGPDVLENITIYEAYSVEDQYSTYQKAIDENDDISLLVVDSFTAQFRMSGDYDGRKKLGDRSADLGKHLRYLGSASRKEGLPILLVGQIYDSPDMYSKGDTPWGGEKMKHFVSYFIRLSSGKGELNTLTVENHPGKGESEVSILIDDDGVQSR